ncbi:MAG TPA: protein-L-isoaspartate O-methyltransferase [Aliiroseovarius sp.]|nr:protein-L-isoaspartate O-methyltransferase [Aliiroseovarius sp.]
MTDFTHLRTTMVDTQIRPSDVTKFPVIEAMLAVPREAFVPDGLKAASYADENIPLGSGRVMLAPRTLAKLLDALDIQPDELVLHVGCGLGYATAVMARMAEFVVALEENEDMAREATEILAEHGVDNAAVVTGPLAAGDARHGPYDVILVEGAVEHLPTALEDQLKEGGRIACLFAEGMLGAARIGYKLDGRVSWRFLFNAGAPVLPGFESHRAFVL